MPSAVSVGRHTWIVALGAGIGLFVADQQTLVATADPNFVPSVILIGAAVVPVAFVLFLYGRRLPYDVPTGVVATTALVGGVLGTVVAGVLEFRTLHRLGSLPLLAVGGIEEASKLIVPAAVLMLLPYRRPADGIVVGVASGAGFAALETMGYAFVQMLQSHGNVSAVDGLLLLRGVLSPAGHMAWTGVAAAALWEARAQRWAPHAVRHFVFSFVAVAVLHALWDGTGTLPGYAVLSAISLGSWATSPTAPPSWATRPTAVCSPT
jgi:RsiW-degrading membrane proteinase PrsW (M82 family)